ncbi:MAG: polysaccharide biosynthesis/export family protein [Bacteroidota bacterium]|jgi:polysaccharide biosynthesis/export protein
MTKLHGLLCVGLLALFASCASPKRTIYFNTTAKADSSIEIVQSLPRPDVIIGTEDIVAVNVSSVDAFTQKDPVGIFNDGGVPYNISAQGGQGATVKGYLVDPEGFIDFPVVGKIQLAGLTPSQAKEKMSKILVDHIKAPVVEVRILNYKINMMGEVGRVGPILAPNHKINILEAITSAGDIPMTGRKDKVLIIRENKGKLEFSRINLNSKSLFTSPYYYLQKNDIVYVEPNRLKRQQTNEFLLFYLPTISTLIASALSVYGIVQLTKR